MAEYLAPGVYVEEIDAGPKPIEGVSTSNAGFVGMTVRGAIGGLPQLVTSFSAYRRLYGGYLPTALGDHRYLPHAVRGFFENGGKRAFITRVPGTGNATAGAPAADGIVTRLLETVEGATGATSAQLTAVGPPAAGDTLTFLQRTGGTTTRATVTLTAVDTASNTVEWDVSENYRGAATLDPDTTIVDSSAPALDTVHLAAGTTLSPGDTAIDVDDRTGIVVGSTLTFVQRVGGATTGPHTVNVTATPGTDTVQWAGAEQIPAGMTFNPDTTLVFIGTPTLLTLAAAIPSTVVITEARLASLRGVEVGTVLSLRQERNGIVTGPHNLTVTGYDAAQSRVTWDVSETPLAGVSFDHRYTGVTVGLAGGPHTTPVRIDAADPGAWGNDLDVQIRHTSSAQSDVVSVSESTPASGTFDVVELRSASNFYTGAIVEFDRGPDAAAANKVYARVTALQGSNITITPGVASGDLAPNGAAAATVARTCEFQINASYEGLAEIHTNLTLDNSVANYYENVVNNNSRLIRVSGGSVTADDPFDQPSGTDGLNLALTGGLDGTAPADAEYIGLDNGPGNRSGIQALTDIDEVSIVAVPGITSQTVLNALIIHCETLMDRFAIIDPAYSGNSALADIQAQRALYDTRYAAIYFPNLIANDPSLNQPIVLPPSGHVAGIYARTDIERGVHKAPANTVVRGILDLDLMINKGEQDILNPRNINVVRNFRADNRGLRVWGARCMTADTDWKYVPVRRLFIFVEESLDEGLQWVVFEPNDEPLWARVRQSITNFLVRVWRDGALMGASVEEAFFVRCDRTTMTQDDIDNGRLIVLVGIAPVKPAEFVIVRIQQYTAEANVTV